MNSIDFYLSKIWNHNIIQLDLNFYQLPQMEPKICNFHKVPQCHSFLVLALQAHTDYHFSLQNKFEKGEQSWETSTT